MRCLYCGKQLALFRRLTGGGEFCSDAHKDSYHDEFNRLALARLKQAQEKSDELRAAAPQNQLALIRRGPGDPEAPSIRSNAHWIEPKPPSRKTLAIAAPEVVQESPPPREADFFSSMPKAAEWSVPLFASSAAQAEPIPAAAIPAIQPEWEPAIGGLELPPSGQIEPTLVPRAREHEFKTDIPEPPAAVEMTARQTGIPLDVPPPPVLPAYPSQPAVKIDPLRFAPSFDVKVEAKPQFLPFRFDFTAFEAPEFDILEPLEAGSQQLKVRPRLTIKRTAPENVLESPAEEVQPIRRRSVGTAKVLELSAIGEIGTLASALAPLYPKSAAPHEAGTELDSVQVQPPSTMMPRSSVLAFREDAVVATQPAVDDGEDKRPSTLKLKLAAMAPEIVPPAPKPETPKAGQRGGIAPARPLERKPVERSAAHQPTGVRRRTVPIPSILEVPPEGGADEQKSLWGALRKYLGK